MNNMDSITHSVKVIIFGHEYTIRGKVDPEFIHKSGELVDHKMKEVGANVPPNTPEHRIAILAAMNIAGDFLKQLSENKEVIQDVQDKSEYLITEIERVLEHQ